MSHSLAPSVFYKTRFGLEIAVPFLVIATVFCALLWPHVTLVAGIVTAVAIMALVVNARFAPRTRVGIPGVNPWKDYAQPGRRDPIGPPHPAHEEPGPPAEAERERAEVVHTAEVAPGGAALAIAAVIIVLAFVLALVLIGWKFALVGTLFILLYMAFVGWPCWLTAIEEQEEFAHERETGEIRSIH